MQRGRQLMQKSSRGGTLDVEEQAYLERVKRAMRERAMGKPGATPRTEAPRASAANPGDWKALVPITDMTAPYKARRIAEHPLTLAKQNADRLRATHIRIGCGSLDGLLPRNAELHDLLTGLHIEHDYEIVPDVAHESPLYYRKLGTKVYDFHAKSLRGDAAAPAN